MGSGAVLLNKVLERRLRRADIRLILDTLCRDDQDTFLDELSDVLRKLITLTEVSTRLSESLSLDVLLSRLIEITTESLEAYRGTVFLHDKDTNELYSRAALGNLIQEIRIPIHQGIVGNVFVTGQPVNIDDAYADARFNPEMDKKTGYKTRNVLAVPIKTKDRQIVGVIQLLNKKSGSFSENDLLMLEAIGGQASAALQNAQTYEIVSRTRHEESMLFQQVGKERREEAQFFKFTREIFFELRMESLFKKITETTATLLAAERSVLYLHDDKANELWSMTTHESQTVRVRFPSHLGIAGSALITGEIVNIPDTAKLPPSIFPVDIEPGFPAHSVLCAPIKTSQGKVVGVIQVRNKKGGPFDRADESRLEIFAGYASIAIRNAELFEATLKSANYFESIFRTLPNGLLLMNANRTIEDCNDAASEILDLPKDRIVGSQVGDIFLGDSKCVTNAVERVVQSAKPEVGMYARLNLLEGRVVTLNLSVLPILADHDRIAGAILALDPLVTRGTYRTLQGYRNQNPPAYIPINSVISTGS